MNINVLPSFLFSINKEKSVFDLLSNNLNNNIPIVKPICTCPICFQNTYDAFQPNNCIHLFCNNCIRIWSKIKKQCPLCRKSYSYLIHKD
jgi:E3 ubiquitin-protein ligase Topors